MKRHLHRHLFGWLLALGLWPPSPALAVPESCSVPPTPQSFRTLVAELNGTSREAHRHVFGALGDRLMAAGPRAGVARLYGEHVALLPRLRYVEGRAALERQVTAIEQLSASERCVFRALLEDSAAGVDVAGLFAYKSSAIGRLAGKDPGRVGEMIEIFGSLARAYHRVGARRHFFSVTYDFVDVFEPIRRSLEPELSRRIAVLLDDLGARRSALFDDLPSGTRPMSD